LKGLIIRWVLNGIGLFVISNLIEGITVTGFKAALVAALVLGIVNAVIRPIVIFFTLPINFFTLGLFTLVINGLMLYIVGSVVDGFAVEGFFASIIGALLLAVFSTAINWVIKDK